mmetsp:Transcript_21646/g.49028  ORF Transcript_21646/g.49028 Transcript_21646/m.49028 type:complete len:316 (+) Transcript_21646:942-1889(+)
MPLQRSHAVPNRRARDNPQHVCHLFARSPRQHRAEPLEDFLLLGHLQGIDVVVDLHEAFQVRAPRHVLSTVIAQFLQGLGRQCSRLRRTQPPDYVLEKRPQGLGVQIQPRGELCDHDGESLPHSRMLGQVCVEAEESRDDLVLIRRDVSRQHPDNKQTSFHRPPSVLVPGAALYVFLKLWQHNLQAAQRSEHRRQVQHCVEQCLESEISELILFVLLPLLVLLWKRRSSGENDHQLRKGSFHGLDTLHPCLFRKFFHGLAQSIPKSKRDGSDSSIRIRSAETDKIDHPDRIRRCLGENRSITLAHFYNHSGDRTP